MILTSLVEPDIGLLVWMLLAFSVVLFLLKKFAWTPILNALEKRDNSIQDALDAAKQAKEEMAQLKAGNEELLREARNERDIILKQAREAKEAVISKAEAQAKMKAEQVMSKAIEDIKNEKLAAMSELRNQVAAIAIEMAEKVLKEHLGKTDKQGELVDRLIGDMNLN